MTVCCVCGKDKECVLVEFNQDGHLRDLCYQCVVNMFTDDPNTYIDGLYQECDAQ